MRIILAGCGVCGQQAGTSSLKGTVPARAENQFLPADYRRETFDSD